MYQKLMLNILFIPLFIPIEHLVRKASNLHVAHVHPCVNYKLLKNELKMNQDSTKRELRVN
jgi:hypothetical protein